MGSGLQVVWFLLLLLLWFILVGFFVVVVGAFFPPRKTDNSLFYLSEDFPKKEMNIANNSDSQAMAMIDHCSQQTVPVLVCMGITCSFNVNNDIKLIILITKLL